MKPTGSVLGVMVLLLILALAGCLHSQAAAPTSDYNVIMISMNNVGAEHMHLYGYGRPTTPRLDALAAHGLVFDHVYSPSSWTLPAATSLFSSTQPYTHDVMNRGRDNLLNPAFPVLGELFKARGYSTAAFTGGLDYRPMFGHLRGMEVTSNNPDFTRFDTSLAQARRWLSYHGEEKFFLVVQGYDAHPPFQPPAPFKGRFSGTPSQAVQVSSQFALRGYKDGDKYVAVYTWAEGDPRKRMLYDIAYSEKQRSVELTQADMDYLRDLYDETVMSVDTQVADFIEGLDPKVRERTIIVLFSEHGEMFGKHGRFGRAGTVRGTLYDDVVHVPLMILTPRGRSGHVGGIMQLIDVAPTLLGLVGIEAPPTFEGRNLLAAGQTDSAAFAGCVFNAGDRPVRLYHPLDEWSVNESIHTDRWALLHEVMYDRGTDTPREEHWELYDVKADPNQLTDVHAANPEVMAELQRRLVSWAEKARAANQARLPGNVTLAPEAHVKAEVQRHGYDWEAGPAESPRPRSHHAMARPVHAVRARGACSGGSLRLTTHKGGREGAGAPAASGGRHGHFVGGLQRPISG